MSIFKRAIVLIGLMLLVCVSNLEASKCENKLFTLNIESKPGHTISIHNVLSDLASSCKISVLYADNKTKEKLKKELDMLYINDLTLDELFELLLNEHNLFYDYDADLSRLKVAYIKTMSFKIDYINVTQMRTYSARDVTVGASTNANEDMLSMGGTQQSSSGQESGGRELVEYSSLSSLQKGENSDFTSTKTIADFTFWDELKTQIDGMLQRDGDTNEVRSMSMLNRDAGLITVSGSYKQLKRVEKYINDLQDRMHKQVLLEVRVLEVSFTEGQQMGVDWSKFELSFSGNANGFGTRGSLHSGTSSGDLYNASFDFSMEGLLNFLKEQGEVEILSSPKVMTLNNQPALINVGDQINYRYENGQIDTVGIGTPSASTTFALGSVFVGLSLTIIPEITENGNIILRINPVDSRIINEDDGEVVNPTGSDVRSIPPDMKVKQLTSIVKVKDGSKVIVGGLVQNEEFDTDTKVPLLGDIPFLGRLFHSTTTTKTKKEFFVVVVPTIIKEDRMPTIEEKEIIVRTENTDDNKSIPSVEEL